MMSVAGRFCIDRWESILVDKGSGEQLSPYYPPDRKLAIQIRDKWETEKDTMGSEEARAIPLPPLPKWQTERDADLMAVSRPGVTPNGYVNGNQAKRACDNAGKRLCTHEEWMTACRGEKDRPYPYGDTYSQGKCNIFRSTHPAIILHNNASIGHMDPRLNTAKDEKGDPLLRVTGGTPSCGSMWGGDTAWDMNGNIDEWVEDPKGKFVGGFFSRSKRDGCQSVITAHPNGYFDYSTGVRCCWSPTPPASATSTTSAQP